MAKAAADASKKRKRAEEEQSTVQDIVIPDYSDEEDSDSSDDDSSDSSDAEDSSDEDNDSDEENDSDDKQEEDTEEKQAEPAKPTEEPATTTQEKKKIDPKFAEFYKRFQSAARNIALAAYNVDEEKDEFGTLKSVKALPMDAVEDAEADAEVRAVMQRREAEAIPQGLIPLPVPDLDLDGEGDEDDGNDVMDESGTPDLAQLRKRLSKPGADGGVGGSLPPWLAHPIHVSSSVVIPFDHIEGLSDKLKHSIKTKLGYADAFAVQATLLPPLLAATTDISPDPRPDILVNAATGSGKTLAYTIPIVQALSHRVVPQLRAIVLLPTRPLITQVVQVFRTLAASASTKLHITSLHGDHTLRSEQERLLKTVPDVIVSTPGRLVDHLRLGTISLKHLQYLVVDEADRLLSDSFNEWATVVTRAIDEASEDLGTSSANTSLLKNLRIKKWSRPAQKLIFSATLTRDPGKLAMLRIRDPQVYIIGGKVEPEGTTTNQGDKISITGTPAATDGKEFTVPPTLTERLVPVKSISLKPLRLMQLISLHQGNTRGISDNSMKTHVLVFVNSNEAAARLARLLTLLDEEVFHMGLVYQRCSSEQPAVVRRRVLRSFAATGSGKLSQSADSSEGPINVLVCTDLVARGIDISSVRNVINYDIPRGPRDYVHRVGRTARAGQTGTAWSFAADRHDHGRFWRGISSHIFREGKEGAAKSADGDVEMHDQDGETGPESSSAVEKYELEEKVPQEGTRDYERTEEGYNRALQRLEKEVRHN